MDEEKAFFNPILQEPGSQERKHVKRTGKAGEREALPPRYGMPVPGEMAARLCRQEWLMNYHMNGWRSAVFAQNCTDRLMEARHWGWTRVSEAPHTAEAIKRGHYSTARISSLSLTDARRDCPCARFRLASGRGGIIQPLPAIIKSGHRFEINAFIQSPVVSGVTGQNGRRIYAQSCQRSWRCRAKQRCLCTLSTAQAGLVDERTYHILLQ